MHDTLDYFATPFGERPDAYHKLTFSMQYFYNELYLLALSHDEVVHGKKTIIDKLWGTYEEKCAQLRTLYFYMYTHPGKKLNFMGNELGHFREWDEKRELDWNLLKYPFHDAFQKYFGALSRLYATQPALYAGEYDPRCFEWVASESRGRFFSAHSAHRASFCALVSFFRAASRRRAADLSVHRSRYAKRCAPSARVHLAPFPLLWACRRLAGSFVQPV